MHVQVIAKVRRTRGGLAIALPKDAVDALGIGDGETVEVVFRRIRKDFFGALRGIGPYAHETPDHA